MSGIVATILNKTAPLGIVGYGFILVLLLSFYLPGENYSGGIGEITDSLLRSWFWAIGAILLFVPLNIWASFQKRKYAIIAYSVAMGTVIGYL